MDKGPSPTSSSASASGDFSLPEIVAHAGQWKADMARLIDFNRPSPLTNLLDPQLTILETTDSKISEIAAILTTSGEQIGAMALIGTKALDGLSQLQAAVNEIEGEAKALRESLEQGGRSARLFSVILVILTVALV